MIELELLNPPAIEVDLSDAMQGPAGPPGNQQVVAASTLIGNATNAAANPIGLTVPEVKSLLDFVSSPQLLAALAAYTPTSSLAPVATSGSASDLITGTLPNARLSPQVVRSDFAYPDPSWVTLIAASKLTGTIPDARLSGNVPLKDAISNAFTGNLTSPRIYVSGTNPQVSPSTSDGADNRTLILMGGGDFGPTTRGPHITLAGLEAATRPGNIELWAGLNGQIRIGGELGGGHVIGLTVTAGGAVQLREDAWHGGPTNTARVYYTLNGSTIHRGYGSIPIRFWNEAGSEMASFNSAGALTVASLVASGDMDILGQAELFGSGIANKLVVYNNATKDYVRFAVNSDTGEARFAGASGDLYIRPYGGSTSITGGTLALHSTASTMSFITNFGTSNNGPLSFSGANATFGGTVTIPVNTWIRDSATLDRIQFIASGATVIRGHGTNVVDFALAGGSAIGRFTTAGLFSFGNISASGSYFLTAGTGPQMYETAGRFTFRNNANTDFAGFIANDSTITSSSGGSIATPAVAGLHLRSALNSYSVGGLFGSSYASNSAHGDIFLWANPLITTADYSNRTQDLAIRGNSGNVEINRGRLVLVDTVNASSWGLKTQYSDSYGQLDFVNHSNTTRLMLSQAGRLTINGSAAGATHVGLIVHNLAANATGLKTQILLPVFNGAGGGVIEGVGNSIDGYRMNFYHAQPGGYLTFGTGGDVERMRIDASGNMIVGTGTAYGRFNLYGGGAYIAQDQIVAWHSAGIVRGQIVGDSTNNIRISTRVGGVLTEGLVITSSGNTIALGTFQADEFISAVGDKIVPQTVGQPWQFLNSSAGALGIKVGNLVVSNSYSDVAPASGLFVKGNAQVVGTLTLAADVWHGNSTNPERLYFATNAGTAYMGYGATPHLWRNNMSTDIMWLSSGGNLTATGHITSAFQTLSADPTTLDIPSGLNRLVKNTASGEVRNWVNDAGVMKKSPAYV